MRYKVGDPIAAFVVAVGDEVQLSHGLSRQDAQADLLYQAYKAGLPVEGRVDAVNKGGLGVTHRGRCARFLPDFARRYPGTWKTPKSTAARP